MHTLLSSCVVALLVLSASMGSAQTILQRAQRDEIKRVEDSNRHMAEAFRKARTTLPEFLALARAPRPTITSMSVKIPIPDRDGTEYFWITPFTERDGELIGRINNTPRSVRNVKLGQLIRFKEADVVDWLYRENGRMIGNFTACALLKGEPAGEAEEFKKRFGLGCDP